MESCPLRGRTGEPKSAGCFDSNLLWPGRRASGGLAPFIGEVLGVKAAPIEYRSEWKRRSLRLGDVAAAEIEGVAWARW